MITIINPKQTVRNSDYNTMKRLLEQRFFQLLSEYSQNKNTANDLTAALQELANHWASIAISEQDYAVLLRYFSFGLNRIE